MIPLDKYYPKVQETQSAEKVFYNSVDEQNKMCLIASMSYLGCQICSEVGELQ